MGISYFVPAAEWKNLSLPESPMTVVYLPAVLASATVSWK